MMNPSSSDTAVNQFEIRYQVPAPLSLPRLPAFHAFTRPPITTLANLRGSRPQQRRRNPPKQKTRSKDGCIDHQGTSTAGPMEKNSCSSGGTPFSPTSHWNASIAGTPPAPWRGTRMIMAVMPKYPVVRTTRMCVRMLSWVHTRMLSQRWVCDTGIVCVVLMVG